TTTETTKEVAICSLYAILIYFVVLYITSSFYAVWVHTIIISIILFFICLYMFTNIISCGLLDDFQIMYIFLIHHNRNVLKTEIILLTWAAACSIVYRAVFILGFVLILFFAERCMNARSNVAHHERKIYVYWTFMFQYVNQFVFLLSYYYIQFMRIVNVYILDSPESLDPSGSLGVRGWMMWHKKYELENLKQPCFMTYTS
ncbi:hypothetical protein ACJX0J_034569, partial [Zea mays]